MSVLDIQAAYKQARLDKASYIESMFAEHLNLHGYSELLRQSEIASIQIEPGRVTFISKSGVKIASSRPDQRSAPIEALNFGSYEPRETAVMLQIIEDGDNILDIGSNIGWFSLLFAKRFPQSRIWAFEPVRPVFDELVTNTALNDCTNISAHNVALSDEEGEFEVFYDPTYSARSSARDLSDGDSQKLICQKVTLDAFAGTIVLPPVQIIKCDVEGAELFAFRGGKNTIARDKPAIFAEMLRKWAAKFGYHPNDIIALLKPMGYVCFDLSTDTPSKIDTVDDQTFGTNFLFLHPDTRASWIERWTAER